MSATDAYFQRLARLMELEAEAEKEAALSELGRLSPAAAEARGYSLIQLVVREEDAGLGGRCLLTLGKRNQSLALPWTRLRAGTPVLLTEEGRPETGWRGVVSRLQKDSLQVAFPQWPEPEGERPTFRLDRATDEIARQRQRQALEAARLAADNRLAALRDVLLGNTPPAFGPLEPLTLFNENLNDSQRAAVAFALSAQDVAILHGPPGTGKTTAVVELIRQLVRRGQTVLACAPSNLAVDNLLEQLIASGENAIRLGHPARVQPALREHTLDLLVEAHPDMRRAGKLTKEAYALRDRAARFTRARPEPGARQALRQEAREMLAEARQIEAQLVDRLLDAAPILCATTTGLDRDLLGPRRFDWGVMDDA